MALSSYDVGWKMVISSAIHDDRCATGRDEKGRWRLWQRTADISSHFINCNVEANLGKSGIEFVIGFLVAVDPCTVDFKGDKLSNASNLGPYVKIWAQKIFPVSRGAIGSVNGDLAVEKNVDLRGRRE